MTDAVQTPPEGVTIRLHIDDDVRLPADTRAVTSSGSWANWATKR